MGKDQGGKIPKAEFDRLLKKKVVSMSWKTFRGNLGPEQQDSSNQQNRQEKPKDKE